MNSLKWCFLAVYLITVVILVVVFKILSKTTKELNKCKTEIVQLESDLEWEKTKAQVKKDVQNEVEKNKKNLETGSVSDRINAAGNILCNGKSSKRNS